MVAGWRGSAVLAVKVADYRQEARYVAVCWVSRRLQWIMGFGGVPVSAVR